MKIEKITKATEPARANFKVEDNSTQAELRVTVRWQISLPVDQIKYPKNLSPEGRPAWVKLNMLAGQIDQVARLSEERRSLVEKINVKTIFGPARRDVAKAAFVAGIEKEFLAAYKIVTTKKHLKSINAQVAELQTQQKEILPEIRRHNSEYVSGCKTAKQAQRDAIARGEFWKADRDLLKQYFNPPFSKNYLADVSEKWRAALFLQVAHDYNPQTGYDGLIPTGVGYLCGIDDNGDEWGHTLDMRDEGDYYGVDYSAKVEDAMGKLFNISVSKLSTCQRQGDLLFCPAKIPAETQLTHQPEWNVRESHTVQSAGLHRNGRYFISVKEIEVTHTSHARLILPAGSYKIYFGEVAD